MLRLAQQRKGKRRGGHTWWMLVAGKGLGEDVTDGAAARPVVAAREGRPLDERSQRKGKAGEETEMSLRERAVCQ